MSLSSMQSSTQSSAATGSAASSTAAATSSSVQKLTNQFMTLLVTQMQNQDPLNPMDNAQITSQMAQLSTVTGIGNLNTTMNSLSSAFMSSQLLQSTSLIGKNVLSAGNTMNLPSGGMATFGVDLPQPVDSLTVAIKDSAGNTIRSINLGAQVAGTMPLQWDGMTDAGTQAPPGTYQFSVQATQSGSSVNVTALSQDVVSSVSQNSQGLQLYLGNGSQVALSGIKQIL